MGAIAGAFAGALRGQPTLCFLLGTAAGTLAAVVTWMIGRR